MMEAFWYLNPSPCLMKLSLSCRAESNGNTQLLLGLLLLLSLLNGFFYHLGSQFCFWLLLHNNLRPANAPLLPLEFADPVVTIVLHGQLLSSGGCGDSPLQERLQGRSVAQKREKNMKHEPISRGKGCLLKS